MRVLSSTYGSRGDAEPLVGLAARVRSRSAKGPVCAPPDFAARFYKVAAAVEECGALMAGGVMSVGVWL